MKLIPKGSIKYYRCLACPRIYLSKRDLDSHKERNGCARKVPYARPNRSATCTTSDDPLNHNPNLDTHQPESLDLEDDVEYVGRVIAEEKGILCGEIPCCSERRAELIRKTYAEAVKNHFRAAMFKRARKRKLRDAEDFVEVIKIVRRDRKGSPQVPLATTPTSDPQTAAQNEVGGSAKPSSSGTSPAAFFSKRIGRTASAQPQIGQRSERKGDFTNSNSNKDPSQHTRVTPRFRYSKPPPGRRSIGKSWRKIVKANRERETSQAEAATSSKVSPVVTRSKKVSPVVSRSSKVSLVVTRSPVRTRSHSKVDYRMGEAARSIASGRSRRKSRKADRECEYCGKVFCSPSSKKRHLTKVHKVKLPERGGPPSKLNIPDPPYNCPLCPKVYQIKSSLQKHGNTVHKKTWKILMTLINKKAKPQPNVPDPTKRAGSPNISLENFAGSSKNCRVPRVPVSKSPLREIRTGLRERSVPFPDRSGSDEQTRPKRPLNLRSSSSSRTSSVSDSDDQSSLFTPYPVKAPRGRPKLRLDQLKYEILPGLKRSRGRPRGSTKNKRSNPENSGEFEQFRCKLPRCGRVFNLKAQAIRHTKEDH